MWGDFQFACLCSNFFCPDLLNPLHSHHASQHSHICSWTSKACSAFLGVQVSLPHNTFIRTEPLIIIINVHHVDTIFDPNSSYVTTILYGRSTCGCKLMRPFRKSYFHVPTVDVCRALWLGSGHALVMHAKVARWRYRRIHYFSGIYFLFCLKYHVKYYDYIVKWCSCLACNWCVSLDNCLNLSFNWGHQLK